jgi:hypothetical protein
MRTPIDVAAEKAGGSHWNDIASTVTHGLCTNSKPLDEGTLIKHWSVRRVAGVC